ncbi:MAG: hypothetical protein VB957_11200 [Pseudomonadales bacterium]|jgi:hypothetical protein
MLEKLKSLGVLRNLLHGLAVLFIILMPFASAPGYTDEWNLFFAGVLPATAPILIILIMMDVMMCQVWKDGESPERIAYFNFAIKSHLCVAGALLLAFLSMFLPALIR